MIRKSFTITFYSPKELWAKFWNRFFWPRRKQCAEWMEVLQVKLVEAIICNIIVQISAVLKEKRKMYEAETKQVLDEIKKLPSFKEFEAAINEHAK